MWAEDAIENVLNKSMQLWVVLVSGQLKAVCVTQIDQYKRGKVLSAPIIGGEDMDKWVEALDDTLTRYAKEQGCVLLSGGGRKGWERVLKPLGWVADYQYRKVI